MNKKQNYKEEAIALLEFNPTTEKYVLNEEALEFIQSVPGPLGVVGVAGMYRTGKSYLLNQMLLNRSDGFGVGPTVNPCTKGLWIWGKPLLGQTADGENINILVVDSEGIGALDEDSTHDSRIFALTILLSSCFIYNSVGSIDENAIQNLSLIVNLTKNIQLKANNSENEQEPDFEDYAQHFPQFIWVLRDFSLQLIDSQGEHLTSKQYLDMTLQAQKGYTESIEQKNRIRKCLTSFFKEKDCHTLVRPLTNEENLQNLDKMQFDELRPEFFEQVIFLRKRILSKMKKKSLQGKPLTGDMYSDLIKSYVQAINEGAIPNIQSAWQYLCENECQKAVQQGIDQYDAVIRDILHNKLPLPLEDLKMFHQTAKQQSLELFRKKAVGEQSQIHLKELTEKIKQRYQQIKVENEKESQRVCHNYIQMEFQAIERKMKVNEYKNYKEFEQDLILFQSFFLENGPKCANKEKYITQFIQSAQNDGAVFFIRNLQQEKEIQLSLNTDVQKRLEADIADLKNSLDHEKSLSGNKIKSLMAQKADLDVKLQASEDSIQALKHEKQKLEQEIKDVTHNLKQEHVKSTNVYKMKLAIAEDKSKESERLKVVAESEFDKERALLNQKIIYYEKTLDEMSKKDKDNTNDFKLIKKESNEQIKELQQKYESQIKGMNSKIIELSEKVQELEHSLVLSEQQLDLERKRWEIEISQKTNTIKDQSQQLTKLSQQLEQYKHVELMNQEFQAQNQESQQLMEQIEGLYAQLKQKDEIVNTLKSSYTKERALMTQKIEFLEVNNKEIRQQLEENNRAHEAILQALDSNNKSNSQEPKQLKELKEQHLKEVKTIESEFEQQKKRLLEQIQGLQERNHDLELGQQRDRSDIQIELQELKDQLYSSEDCIKQLQEQIKLLENAKNLSHNNQEERYLNRIRSLEEDLEQVKSSHISDMNSLQQKNEFSLAQLKNIYEIERESLEKRIQEEREKWDKKVQNLNEEYFEKMREDQAQWEEDNENLKEELREQEQNYHNMVAQYEHELALKSQTVETLEKYISETKESLMNLQNNNNQSLETHINSFSLERKQLLEKNEQLVHEIQKKEKENLALIQKKEYLENTLSRKEGQLTVLKQEFTQDKDDLTEKLEHTKIKLQEISDELLDHKINFSKEIALSNQKNEFLQKKNDDLQKNNEQNVTRYEEKLKFQKMELNQEHREKVQKMEEERAILESKFEKTKKSLKEIETTYNKQLSQIERDKAIIQEKLYNLEQKKGENDQKMKSDMATFQSQFSQQKEQFNNEKKQIFSELEKYKQQNLALEQEKNDLMTNYDRDKALWEGKFQFLDQQKEQAKQDLVDALKKFEITLQHLQKARNNEKDEHESSLNELLQSMEKKYQSQINEINDNHYRVVQDYEDKLRRLNKEVKQLKEHNYIEKFGKQGNQLLNEKKLSEFMENEKRLLNDIENLKSEREQKNLEFQRILDMEKENFKEKISQIEQKYKEAEHRRSQMLFEYEKERAKWNMDKDHLIQQKNEFQETVEKLEKKKEILLRENEKLRNDNKVTKRSINLLNQGVSGLASNILQKGSKNMKNSQQSPISNVNKSMVDQNNPSNLSCFVNVKKNLNDITNQTAIHYNDQGNQSILGGIRSPANKKQIQHQQHSYYDDVQQQQYYDDDYPNNDNKYY